MNRFFAYGKNTGLAAFFFLALAYSGFSPFGENTAHAQTVCNDPSGFLKTSGPITLGDQLVLGPDCQHVKDGGISATVGVIPTTSVVTLTLAAPGNVNWPSHNLTVGTPVFFSTTGTLPTPLVAQIPSQNPTAYYVIPVDTNNFQLATTPANALAGIAFNLTGSQSGTQTAVANGVACAGCIGEFIWKTVPLTGPGSNLVTTVDQVWVTIQVSTGVWQGGGQSGVFGGAGAVFTGMTADYGVGLAAVRTSPCAGACVALNITSNNSNGWIFPNGETLLTLTATQNINGVLNAAFSGGTAVAYGTIWARRIH